MHLDRTAGHSFRRRLWSRKLHESLRRDLLDTLEAVECEHIISQQRGKLGIVPEEVDCDYYDWCNGKRGGRVWNGEYMAQYSWSEYTAGVLERMSKI